MSTLVQVKGAKVIAGGRTAVVHAELPAPHVSTVSGFTVRELPNGMAELVDASGRGCGLFSAKQIAQGTADLLNR